MAKATLNKANWAVRLFRDWREHRNARALSDPSQNISPIQPQLEEMTKDELNFCLSRFLCEVNAKDGKEYQGDTLKTALMSIQLHLEREVGIRYHFTLDSDFLQVSPGNSDTFLLGCKKVKSITLNLGSVYR